MLVRLETLTPWNGEPLSGLRHPANIEALWSADELAAIGLAKPKPFSVPDGKVAVGPVTYVLVNGSVEESREVEDAPNPVPQVITKLQLRNALVSLDLWATLRAALDADLEAQEVFDLASDVNRGHPLVAAFAQSLGKTNAEIDGIFRMAAGL